MFDSPTALWPPGERWDRRILEILTGGRPEGVMDLTEAELAEGGLEEGGLHALYTLLGAVGKGALVRILSYEGIVGVGSAVVGFELRPAG